MGEASRWRLVRWMLLLAVPVLLVVLARSLFPADRVKARITEELTRATGAEVSLGEASLAFGPGIRVAIAGGSIRGTGAALAEATGATIDVETYAVDLSEFDVALALGPLVRRQVEISDLVLEGPSLTARWDEGGIRVEEFRLRISHLTMGLRGSDYGSAPGDNIPPDLAFDLRVEAARLVSGAADYADLVAAGRFAARTLDLVDLRAVLGTGEVRGTAFLDYRNDPHGHLAFEATLDRVPAPALFGPWWADLAARLEGDLSGEATGTMQLRDEATRRNTLAAEGFLESGPGRLDARDWLHEASAYLGDRQDLKIVDFEALRHDFVVAEGRYHLRDLTLTGGQTEWRGRGWIDLGANLEVKLGVRLPAGFTPDLGSWSFLADGLRDPEGRVNLAFNLTGPAHRPVLAVDLAGLLAGGRSR